MFKLLIENFIINRYIHYGSIEGDAGSYGAESPVEGRFMFFEQKYISYGYVPIPGHKWVDIGGYGESPKPYLRLRTQEAMDEALANSFFRTWKNDGDEEDEVVETVKLPTKNQEHELYQRMISSILYARIAMNNPRIVEIIEDWNYLFRCWDGEYTELEKEKCYASCFARLQEKYIYRTKTDE